MEKLLIYSMAISSIKYKKLQIFLLSSLLHSISHQAHSLADIRAADLLSILTTNNMAFIKQQIF